MKLIGTSKLAVQNKITVIEEVVKKLELKQGDKIAFLESDQGDIIIQKLSEVEISRRV